MKIRCWNRLRYCTALINFEIAPVWVNFRAIWNFRAICLWTLCKLDEDGESLQMRHLKSWLAAAVVAIGAGSLALTATPAIALDDDGHQSLFKTFTGILSTNIGIPGFTSSEPKGRINYRERAPLVLPPNRKALRRPTLPVRARNKAWPKDYDRQRIQRARNANRRFIRRDEAGNQILSARQLREMGRLKRNPRYVPVDQGCDAGDPLSQLCNPTKHWRTLKNAKKLKGGSKDLLPGVEPRRAALTDPPPGYRKASRRQKYTYEPIEDTPIVKDPRETIIEEARREEKYR